MIGKILAERIREYNPANPIEQENALQELLQKFVLASLSRSGFFKDSIFHGGTCLRIAYGTSRYSEDLDFLLKSQSQDFAWQKYIKQVISDSEGEGIHFSFSDRSHTHSVVKKIILSADSADKLLPGEMLFHRDPRKIIRIKLEIDTNPPAGSHFETRYIYFPYTAAITTQTLQCSFSLKMHALLCRKYIKGRDWYDFIWYVSKKIKPDLRLLVNALQQESPWAGKNLQITPEWLLKNMHKRIVGIDWKEAKQDVQKFIFMTDQESLELWNKDFFLFHLRMLKEIL